MQELSSLLHSKKLETFEKKKQEHNLKKIIAFQMINYIFYPYQMSDKQIYNINFQIIIFFFIYLE